METPEKCVESDVFIANFESILHSFGVSIGDFGQVYNKIEKNKHFKLIKLETYSEPGQTPKGDLFAKTVIVFQPPTLFVKNSIIDI